MGEVISFWTHKKNRHPSATDLTAPKPAPKPASLNEHQQEIVALSEAFLKLDAKQRVLAGLASIFKLQGIRRIPVVPRILETSDPRISVVHNLRTENGKTVICVPSAFPKTLRNEAGLSPGESVETTVDYTFSLGTIIHGLKAQAGHNRTSGPVPPLNAVPTDSFDARQWPTGTTPIGAAPYRAAATMALATNHPDGLLVANPDAAPDPQHRSIQISALANPLPLDETYAYYLRSIIEDATRPASL